MTKYYTLVASVKGENKWYPQFGDYSKQVVKEEMDYLKQEPLGKNLVYQILETSHSQAAIDLAIFALNHE